VSDHALPRQVLQRYLSALVTGDAETIRYTFTDDATWMICLIFR